jgi:lipopolysaccharide biosynthesis protein
MAGEIFQRIARCNARPDLLISVRDQKAKEMIEALMPEYSLTAKRVAIVPNRGRNLGPLLTEFGQEIMNDYDLMGHLHTKKSLDLADREFVKRWTDFLCENLLGGEFAMMDVILSQLNDHPRLGLVFPDDPNIRGWSKNRRFAEELAVRMGLDGTNFPENINFPTGTMFWARTEALRPLFDLNLHWEEYPQEPLSYDGSILHAIERMLPLIAESMEYGTAVTNIPTITR